jgi:hypothetical protein
LKTNKIVGLLLAVSMLFTLVCPAFAADAAVQTDKAEYKHGETVTITTDASNQRFRVVNPNKVELFEAVTDGTTYTFKIPAKGSELPAAELYPEGEYTIKAGADFSKTGTFKIKDGGSSTVTGDPTVSFVSTSTATQNVQKNIFSVKNVSDYEDLVVSIVVKRGTSTINTTTGYTVKFDGKICKDDIETTGTALNNKSIAMTFKKTGSHTVEVTVTDKDGNNVAEGSKKITVSEQKTSGSNGNGSSSGSNGGTTIIGGNTTVASGYIAGQIGVTTTPNGTTGSGIMTAPNGFMVNVTSNGAAVTNLQGFDPVKVRVPYLAQASQNTMDLVVMDAYGNVVPRAVYANGNMVMGTKTVSPSYTIQSSKVSFNDVSADWAVSQISALAVRGIINGVGDNNYDPDRVVTRAEFAKMLVTMFDIYDASAYASFADVEPGAWYASYIGTASKYGIVNGRGDGTFDPNARITRQEMSAMLYRAATAMGVSLSAPNGSSFNDDAAIHDWAKESVYSMQASSVLKGVGDNTFDPQGDCSRAQGAVAIYNMLVASLK